jgi:hypothetical protein
MCVKPRKAKVAEPLCLAVALRKAPEFDDPGLLRMQLQSELLQSLSKFVQEPLGNWAPLEAHDGVVGIADDDDLAVSFLLPPLVDQTGLETGLSQTASQWISRFPCRWLARVREVSDHAGSGRR